MDKKYTIIYNVDTEHEMEYTFDNKESMLQFMFRNTSEYLSLGAEDFKMRVRVDYAE